MSSVRYKNKYERLRDALEAAKYNAEKAVENMTDRPPCNFDSTRVYFGRGWKEAEIIKAAEEAGIHAFRNSYGTRVSYTFCSPILAQGTVNTAQAEAMTHILKFYEYDAYTWYHLD